MTKYCQICTKRIRVFLTRNPNGVNAMNNDLQLSDAILFLFNRNYEDDLSEKEETTIDNLAEEVVNEFGWTKTFDCAFDYLKKRCATPEAAVNFAHLYFQMGWHEKAIPNPYQFVAWFYFQVDLDASRFDATDILDSLACAVLSNSGVREANLWLNPRYAAEVDPKLVKEVNELRLKCRNSNAE